MQSRTIRQMVRLVNASAASATVASASKFTPKAPRQRLLRPASEDVRWLAGEVSLFTMQAVARAGSQAELARLAKVHPTTIMRMLDGELVGLRVIGLIANKLRLRFSLMPAPKGEDDDKRIPSNWSCE